MNERFRKWFLAGAGLVLLLFAGIFISVAQLPAGGQQVNAAQPRTVMATAKAASQADEDQESDDARQEQTDTLEEETSVGAETSDSEASQGDSDDAMEEADSSGTSGGSGTSGDSKTSSGSGTSGDSKTSSGSGTTDESTTSSGSGATGESETSSGSGALVTDETTDGNEGSPSSVTSDEDEASDSSDTAGSDTAGSDTAGSSEASDRETSGSSDAQENGETSAGGSDADGSDGTDVNGKTNTEQSNEGIQNGSAAGTESEDGLSEEDNVDIQISPVSADDLDYDEDTVDTAVMAYILEHLDTAYTGQDFFEVVNLMVVKQTIADRASIDGEAILEALFEQENYAEAIYTVIPASTAVYNLSNDSDYFVSYANTLFGDSEYETTDAVFAIYSDDGEVVEGCIYDVNSGLVYIPKTLYYNEEGAFEIGRIQVQFLQLTDTELTDLKSEVSTSVETSDGDIQTADGWADLFSYQTTVETKPGLSEEELIVYVNGIVVEEYTYDSESGELVIPYSSASVESVTVQVEEKGIVEKILEWFAPLTAQAAEITYGNISGSLVTVEGGSIVFSSAPEAGDTFTDTMTIKYEDDADEDETTSVSTYGGITDAAADSIATLLGSDSSYSEIEDISSSLWSQSGMKTFLLKLNGVVGDEDSGEKTVDFSSLDQNLSLFCSHISKANVLGSAGSLRSNVWVGVEVMIRVLKVEETTAGSGIVVLGFLTQTANTQAGYGVIAFEYETADDQDAYGYIDLCKLGYDEDGNLLSSSEYPRIGAVYTVYTDEACTTVATTANGTQAKLVTNTNWGNANQIRMQIVDTDGDGVYEDSENTYYVRETTAPEGYYLDETIYTVVLTANGVDEEKTASASTDQDSVTVYEKVWIGEYDEIGSWYESDTLSGRWAISDTAKTVSFSMTKQDSEDDTITDFSGTVYTVYAAYELDEDEDSDTYTYVETDENGQPVLTDPVGTLTYDAGTGAFSALDLSPGYYYIQETASTEGYAMDSTVYRIKVRIDEVDLQEDGTCYNFVAAIWSCTDVSEDSITWSADADIYAPYDIDSRDWRISIYFTRTTDEEGNEVLRLYGSKHDGNTGVISGLSFGAAFSDEALRGYVSLRKSSSNTELTADNACYSLAGAVYGVYLTESDAQSGSDCVGTLTTDADGLSNTLTLSPGTYTVKELTAPEGYALDQTLHTVEVVSGETTTLSLEDEPLADTDGIGIVKIDAVTNTSVPQGEASLAGAQFTIRYYAGYYESADELPESAVRTWVIETKAVTDSSGEVTYQACLSKEDQVSGDEFYYVLDEVALPLGTITIEETQAPDGYTLEGSWLYEDGSAADTSDGSADGNSVIYMALVTAGTDRTSAGLDGGNLYLKQDTPIYGSISIQKWDSAALAGIAQGDASLAGAVFAIYNASKNAVVIDGTVFASGDEVLRITADETGYVAAADTALPYGIYTIAEVSAPEGYVVCSDTKSFEITENGQAVTVNFENEVLRGGISIQKRDLETGETSPQGGTTLAGVKFEVANVSEAAVYVTKEYVEESAYIEWIADEDGDGWYEPGEVLLVITTDENGLATLDGDGDGSCQTLPYGTYTVTEIQASDGYELSETEAKTVRLNDENTDFTEGFPDGGIAVCDVDQDTAAFYDQALRGDFRLRKVDRDYQALAGVLWQITSNTTGETHYFVTDENGEFYSSWSYASHTEQNANGNDAAVTVGEDGSYQINEDLLNSAYGIWFGEGTSADTDLAALPCDIYTLTEIETSVNEGMVMRSFTLTISQKDDGSGTDDADHELEYEEVDLGTIVNVTADEADLQTNVSNGEDGTQFAAAADGIYILDEITLTGTTAGSSYTIYAVLMDPLTGEAFTDIDGETYCETLTVSGGTTYIVRSIEFDDVNLTGMEGRSIVVFVYVTDENGGQIAEAAVLTDRSETIYIPEISTQACDTQSGLHMSQTEEEVRITDTITYSNVAWGKQYVAVGILYDADTKEALLDESGSLITAQTRFWANSQGGANRTYEKDGEVSVANGSIEVTFTVDAKELAGKTIVVYEYLCYSTADISTGISTENTICADRAWISDGLLAWEEDPDSEAQSVHFPALSTSATDADTGTKSGSIGTDCTIIDTVSFENLLIGAEYTVTGTLYDSQTGEVLEQDGNLLSQTTTFTLQSDGSITVRDGESADIINLDADGSAADGTVTVTFTGIDSTQLVGHQVVVYEILRYNGITLAVHADQTDEAQIISYEETEETESETEPEEIETESETEPEEIETEETESEETETEETEAEETETEETETEEMETEETESEEAESEGIKAEETGTEETEPETQIEGTETEETGTEETEIEETEPEEAGTDDMETQETDTGGTSEETLSETSAGQDVDLQESPKTGDQMAPVLLAAGIFGALSVLFLTAAVWYHKRSSDE